MNSYPDQMTWSAAEKKAARAAFERAYHKQCAAIGAKVKQMITQAPDDPRVIWGIHEYLSEKRRETDELFDYRYSVLIFVFGRLLGEGWLTEADLAGLSKDKMETIRRLISP